LNNVIKHAHASEVNIELQFEPDQVILRICDNGRGFDPAAAAGPREGHFGLQGMSERVKRVGGRFEIISTPGGSTTIQVEVPLAPAPETPPPNFDSLTD
jgi:signal transduction histidine kinase